MTTKFKGIKWLAGPCSLLLTPLGTIRDVLGWVKEELDQSSPILPPPKEDTNKREH